MTEREAHVERRDKSTLAVTTRDSAVTVSMLTTRIARVEREGKGRARGPFYAVDREWAPVSVNVIESDPLRLLTTDLKVEIAVNPLRLAFIDPRGDWLLRQATDAGLSDEPA